MKSRMEVMTNVLPEVSSYISTASLAENLASEKSANSSVYSNTSADGLVVTMDGTQQYSRYNQTAAPMGGPRPEDLMDTMNDYTLPVYGYISPILVLFTVITNTLVCIVLLKRHMRSPTNTMLVAMAVSDTLTGIWPLPFFIYFFTLKHYQEYIPFSWCFANRCLTEFLPTIFHTASIWLTVALAAQRYIYVCHSLKAKQWCTIANVIKTIFAIYIVSLLAHICRFFESVFVEYPVPSKLNPNVTINACFWNYVPFVKKWENEYFNVYFWFRVIAIHLFPCIILVVINAILVVTMRNAQRRRQMLLKQNKKSESRKLKESNCTTLMLVAVVGVFLVGELPAGIIFIIMIVQNTMAIHIMDAELQNLLSMFTNLFILFSYPINFFIYCGMSRQFRETFRRLFIPDARPLDREHSQYMSLATENGGKTLATNETAI